MSLFSELELNTSPIGPGLTVIEASAGTGKTYSISHLVPRLLLEGDLPDLSKLLLVTFTRDATRELADRTRRVLTRLAAPPAPDETTTHPHVAALRPRLADPSARARLARALLDLDLLAVSTIHAFCQRTLQQDGTLCGLPVMPEVITDDTEHLTPLVREHWLATLATDPVLAALATAQDWKLEDARTFLNTLRRCHHPRLDPAPTPYAELRAALTAGCTRLADSTRLAPVPELVAGIPAWNQGLTADAVLDRLAPLQAGDPARPAYWEALRAATELPGLIKANSHAGRAARAAITAHPGTAAARELAALAARLRWAWQQDLAARVLPRLASLLETRRLITQDGLIGALHRALHRSGPDGEAQSARLAEHLARRYHVALIDESQDTDPRQFAIFRRIFLDTEPCRRLLLVGDPKQAIYGFRGADLSTYLAARNGAGRGYTLTRTHRAPAPLVRTLNRLFDRPRAFHHPDLAFRPARSALPFDRRLWRDGAPCPRLEAWLLPEGDPAWSSQGRRVAAISARIAATIVDLVEHGRLRTTWTDGRAAQETRVSPQDFAVLVATNAQAVAMAEALQARAVPAVVNSGADVFASDEARDLHRLLRAVLDPRRTRRLRAALATRLLGVDAATLARLDETPAPGAAAHQASVVWFERFTRWHQLWHARGLAALVSDLERPDVAVTHRLALVPLTGERRATNHRHLTDLLLEAARTAAPRPAELVRWLGQEIARATDRSFVEERQLQLSSDRAAVQIVTMHKAKGLEYPLVFCPYLADSLRRTEGLGQLPAPPTAGDRSHADVLVNLDLLDGDARAARARQLAAAQLEERLRLAYVALTRAQAGVWITCYRATRSGEGVSALDWLLRSDADLATYPEFSHEWIAATKAAGIAPQGAVLDALGAEAPGDVAVREPPPDSAARLVAVAAADPFSAPLAALPAPPLPPGWRITSFSTLTREKHAHGAPLPPAPAAPATRAPPPEPPDGAGEPALHFFAAPGGAAVGTAVHDWIETWDFTPPDEAALASHLATAQLPALPPESPGWGEQWRELFTTLRLIRLPGCDGAPLHALCAEPHASEWHFHLPLAGPLRTADLARCFELHGAPAHRPYAAALRELSDDQFDGLLQGFIDRLVRHGPAWGVIDWKTNRLGSTLADYDEASLLRCAINDHYLLQTHLYLVALRRYLRALGLADPPLAGAWLVFLRAVAPGTSRGVLHLNPPGGMLDALDALFAPRTATRP